VVEQLYYYFTMLYFIYTHSRLEMVSKYVFRHEKCVSACPARVFLSNFCRAGHAYTHFSPLRKLSQRLVVSTLLS